MYQSTVERQQVFTHVRGVQESARLPENGTLVDDALEAAETTRLYGDMKAEMSPQ